MKKFVAAMISFIAFTPAMVFADGIEARDGWARATPPTVDIGAVYLTIHNDGDTDDRLIGARSTAAGKIEIHKTTFTDDVMRMRPVKDVEIRGGQEVVLDPDGYHLMLFGLTAPLTQDQTVTVDLDFERAGTVPVTVKVRALIAGEDSHEQHTGHVHGAPAPIGVMGDHMHGAGEFMLSYRFMRMDMDGNQIGTDSVSPEEIVTSVSNPHAGPATLRVVPTHMTTNMHMFGLMAAPTDWFTLMVMGSYLEKEMDHITFMGMTGTTRRGTFTTRSSGVGDTRVNGLFRVYQDSTHHVHLNAGLSLPTGSIDEEDDVLTPMGTTPTLTLPYAMQLGSGTWDLIPGVTYTGTQDEFGWGAQYTGLIRLGDNDRRYSLGNEHWLTGWGSLMLGDGASTSLRLTGRSIGEIDGQDSRITAPVQTADPTNYGGERLDISVGLNFLGQDGLMGSSLGLEVGMPVYQDLNGPQMSGEFFVMLGAKFAF